MVSPPSIAIVGAGPAGLSLARLLQVSASEENVTLNVTIFEKDASPSSRFEQGGTLDLHPNTGLAAIKAMNLWDEFQEFARYEGEELAFVDKNGMEFVHMKEAAKVEGYDSRPEIDREKLKMILLQSVDPKTIQWGKQLKKVTDEGTLTFADESTAGPFDLIVGADGGWSRVAHVLTDVRPTYSGVAGFQMSIAKPNEDYPALSKLVGRGSYFVASDAKSIMAQRMGDESLKASIWMTQEADAPARWMAETGSDEAKLKEKILQHYQDWVPEITQIVSVGTSFRAWPLYELPITHSWPHKKGYTLIGDAAHLMTPFAGEGVNAAMKDALELSGAIIASQKTGVPMDTVLRIFEEEMFPRMNRVQEDTMRNKTRMFREDAPVGMMLGFLEDVARETGWDVQKGIWSWVFRPLRGLAFCYFQSLALFGRWRRRWRAGLWRKG